MARRALAMASVGWSLSAGMTALTVAGQLAGPAPVLPGLMDFGSLGLLGLSVPSLSFASIGAFLAIRRPANAIGWLLLLASLGFAASGLATSIASTGGGAAVGRPDAAAFAAWVATAAWPPAAVVLLATAYLFPTGRPQSPGWALALRVQLLIWALLYGLALVRPGPLLVFETIENPFGFGPDLGLTVGPMSLPFVLVWHFVITPPALLAILMRYVRGGALERAQIRWLLLAVGITTVCASLPLAAAAVGLAEGSFNAPSVAVKAFAVAATSIPVAYAIAILRYRLFDIDRLISRTITYAGVSAMLLALYAGSIIVLQAPLGSLTNGQSVAVAVSTFLVATLFQPVRRRIQQTVDRRFHRARYDAERTTATFADRLRNQVDMATLSADLDATVRAAIQPSSLGIWLREHRS